MIPQAESLQVSQEERAESLASRLLGLLLTTGVSCTIAGAIMGIAAYKWLF